MLLPGQHIHIVGIGGVGMSAIARVLLSRGYAVSGSDRQANDLTAALAAQGARVFEGHRAENLGAVDAVVISSAVPADNPELVAARARGIPVYKRRDILGELMRDRIGVAVAGTHGKTTTTSMIVHILTQTGREPTYIVGGVVATTGSNAGVGQGEAFVIEADEYDHMFLGLRPRAAVITSIEHDHPDMFPTIEDLLADFRQFVALVPAGGILAVCVDDPLALAVGRGQVAARLVTYGLHAPEADWRAEGWQAEGTGIAFTAVPPQGEPIPVRLGVPGQFNIQNALAALIVTAWLGVPAPEAAAALASFRGAGRRFDVRGQAGGVTGIDAYAPHPTAIRVTLAAARAAYPTARIWAVWQPHTFSRLRTLFEDFGAAFHPEDCDRVLITDVYASREQRTPGPDVPDLIARMAHPAVRHTPTLADATATLASEVGPGDVVIILSAGDAPRIGIDLLARLEARP